MDIRKYGLCKVVTFNKVCQIVTRVVLTDERIDGTNPFL